MKYTLAEHKGKKLVSGELFESVGVQANINRESIQALTESAQGKKRKLIVQMEAIHVGRTANYTYYTKEGLSGGLNSWTTPYNKPVLTHHNDYNGEPIGRILKAEFSEATRSGKPGLIFTCEITDPTAMEKVLDGRYQTVSIGATTDKVTCNICGTDRIHEWCDHWPGETYEGQTAHFIIGNTFGKEISYVNTPADENAGNFSVSVEETEAPGGTQESVHTEIFQIAEGLFQNINQPQVNLYEHVSKEAQSFINGLLSERSDNPVEGQENTAEVPVTEGQGSETPVAEGEKPTEAPAAPATPETPVTEGEKPTEEPVVPETPAAPVTESVPTAKVSEMQATITRLVLENESMKTKLSEKDTQMNTVLAENASLHSQIHRSLAEKVVDLKRSLNKPDVVGKDREESIGTHVARSKESLENTLNDLLLESKAQRPVPGSVVNPGYSGEESEGQGAKTYTVAEAENMFKNMFGGKRKK